MATSRSSGHCQQEPGKVGGGGEPTPAAAAAADPYSPLLTASFLDAANPLELNNVGVSFSQTLTEDEETPLAFFQRALNDQVSYHQGAAPNAAPSSNCPCCTSATQKQQQQASCAAPSSPATATPLLSLVGLSAALGIGVPFRSSPNIYSAPYDGGTSVISAQADEDLSASPSNYFSVYNQLFAFKDLKAESLSWTHRTFLTPAVILYNMGLTYHRLALKDIRTERYEQALYFYSLSIRIVEECINCGLYVSDFSLLQLALYNNMGFTNSHFFNENEAMACAGRLLATFASMDCSRLLSKDEYVFYYMNLLFLLNRNPKFAPAA